MSNDLFQPIHLLIIVFVLPFLAVVVAPYWVIFKKAGFPGALSLLVLVPIVNLVVLYVIAFSRWKVVPAPEFAMGYPSPYPPPGYVPAAPVYPPVQAAPPVYVPPPDPPAAI